MNKRQDIKALGFIEVLIAIVVVGIVSAVFLSIAGTSMKDLIQTERIEYMARLAKDGFNAAQDVANHEKQDIVVGQNNNYFPDNSGSCYIPIVRTDSVVESQGLNKYAFEKDASGFITFSEGEEKIRESIVTYFVESSPTDYTYVGGADYFVVMCIESLDTINNWANVKFWVGDLKVAGEITNDSDVKDFTYYAVVEL